MTASQQFIEDIEILLENSEYTAPIFATIDGADVSEHINAYVHLPESERQISHPQAIDVSKIYYQENKKNQQQIHELLMSTLSSNNARHAKTAAYTLFQIGRMDTLVEELGKIDLSDFSKRNTFRSLMSTISLLVSYFWKDITKTQIKGLRLIFKDLKNTDSDRHKLIRAHFPTINHINYIVTQLNIVLTQDVRERIDQGFNPEINEDETKLKNEITKFGFPEDLTEALDKIDQKLQASKDAFDFKGTMDLLRAFTERVYRSVLDSYGDTGKGIDEKDSEAVAKYFKEQSLVNENFASMIVSMRHFLSNTAAHRLKSRSEDARLTKNMVIEMTLYLLIRLKNN